MGNYYGRYERTLDERGRLQLPSKLFGNALPKSFFTLKGFEGCVSIYEKAAFDSLLSELSQKSYLVKNNRSFIRATLDSVKELEVDAHGRITISKDLSERYEIKSAVVVLGVIDHFEIWDQEKYEAYLKDAKANYEQLAEEMGGNDNA